MEENQTPTQWVIIGAAVIVLIVGGAWLAMRGTENGILGCDSFANLPQKDIPARCITYFNK